MLRLINPPDPPCQGGSLKGGNGDKKERRRAPTPSNGGGAKAGKGISEGIQEPASFPAGGGFG